MTISDPFINWFAAAMLIAIGLLLVIFVLLAAVMSSMIAPTPGDETRASH